MLLVREGASNIIELESFSITSINCHNLKIFQDNQVQQSERKSITAKSFVGIDFSTFWAILDRCHAVQIFLAIADRHQHVFV